MNMSCIMFRENMGGDETLVCVKQVKQEVADEWDEGMPLPGDIIEGFGEEDGDDSFVAVKAKFELSSHLAKINPQVGFIWLKVRRGNSALKLKARVVRHKNLLLQRRYAIQAATDPRHIADLDDLTVEQCSELQEMSRRFVNVKSRGFRRSGIKYDWKMKVANHLPDQSCSVVSSILFMPLEGEHCVHATTVRCMAWFNAAVSSGVPLVFVNIQTQQIVHSEKTDVPRRETGRSKQQNHNTNSQIMQGIRLWYLPGVAEISIQMIPPQRELRFGMEIKHTEEGFLCIYSVTGGSAADGAGVKELYEEATVNGFLLVISRLQGKSVMPSTVCFEGLIRCCDHSEIKDSLVSAMDESHPIQMHIMAWPNQNRLSPLQPLASAALLPPTAYSPHDDYHSYRTQRRTSSL